MASCLRCEAAPLEEIAVENGGATRFFQCPRCLRHYASKPGQGLVDRWLSPISLVLYPIIFSKRPQDDVERVVGIFLRRSVPKEHRDILEEETVEEHRNKLDRIIADIRAELAQPKQRVREILDLAQPEDVVSEADVREFLRGVANGLEAAHSSR